MLSDGDIVIESSRVLRAGQNSLTVSITIINDQITELDEQFLLRLVSEALYSVEDDQAGVVNITIRDNDRKLQSANNLY